MYQKHLIGLSLSFVLIHFSIAQSQPVKNDNHFEFEADPTAYILHGYSAHLGYQSGHFRYDVGVFAAREPSFFTGYDNFNIRSNGGGVKIDYLFKKRKGFLLGIESDLSREQVSPKSKSDAPGVGPGTDPAAGPGTDLTHSFTNVSLAMRVGYRWMFGSKNNDCKGFYIFPWVSFLSLNLNPQSASIQGQEYRQKPFSVFPTVHIGYSF